MLISLISQAAPVTADDHVRWGKAALRVPDEWAASDASLTEAASHFEAALALSPTHGEAIFYKALTRLLSLQKEAAFGQLLSQLGMEDRNMNSDDPEYVVPRDIDGKSVFAAGANTTQGVDYADSVVRPRLEEILALLGAIKGNAFRADIPDWIGFGNARHTKWVDLGDIGLFRSSCSGVLGLLDYAVSVDLAASLEAAADMEHGESLDAESVEELFGDLLRFSGTNRRKIASTNLVRSIDQYNQGSSFARLTRPKANDPYHLFSVTESGAEDETQLRGYLGKIKRSLGGKTETIEGWGLNLSKLFTATQSPRELSPHFKQNQVIKGSLLDPKLGGMLPTTTLAKMETELRDRDSLYEGDLMLTLEIEPGQEALGTVSGD
ncbi:MAG: hypothetical protein KDM64_03185, partial [Verrucomicrobiae bacterium]|nr:hypothetical protein [Verrucomicrobiae bacterium]